MNSMPEAATLLARALSGDDDWLEAATPADAPRIASAAVAHGVAELVWGRLAAVGETACALRAALDSGVRAAATRDVFVRRELARMFDAFAQAGVQVLVTKGAALAYTAYEQPWQRPRTDTDLLVRHADVADATRVLERCGYARSDALSTGSFVSHQIAFERTDDHGVAHVVDLHWKIVNPQILAGALPFDTLWQGARPIAALGTAAMMPSAEGCAAIACLHRLAHHQGNERLIWLYDLKLLTSAFDREAWPALCDLSRAQGIAGICLDGLRAARRLLRSSLPTDVETTLAAAAPAERSNVYAEGTLSRRDVLLSDMRTLSTWSSRLRLLREHVFPSPAFIRQRYNSHSGWPLPALYLYRLVAGASRWIRS